MPQSNVKTQGWAQDIARGPHREARLCLLVTVFARGRLGGRQIGAVESGVGGGVHDGRALCALVPAVIENDIFERPGRTSGNLGGSRRAARESGARGGASDGRALCALVGGVGSILEMRRYFV